MFAFLHQMTNWIDLFVEITDNSLSKVSWNQESIGKVEVFHADNLCANDEYPEDSIKDYCTAQNNLRGLLSRRNRLQ